LDVGFSDIFPPSGLLVLPRLNLTWVCLICPEDEIFNWAKLSYRQIVQAQNIVVMLNLPERDCARYRHFFQWQKQISNSQGLSLETLNRFLEVK